MTTHIIHNKEGAIPFADLLEGSFFLRNKDKYMKIFPVMGKTQFFNTIHIKVKGRITHYNNVNIPAQTLIIPIPNEKEEKLEKAVLGMWTMIQKANQHLDGLINQVQVAGGNPAMFLQLKKILTPIKRNE